MIRSTGPPPAAGSRLGRPSGPKRTLKVAEETNSSRSPAPSPGTPLWANIGPQRRARRGRGRPRRVGLFGHLEGALRAGRAPQPRARGRGWTGGADHRPPGRGGDTGGGGGDVEPP